MFALKKNYDLFSKFSWALLLVMFTMFSCEKTEIVDPEIVIKSESTITFHPSDSETEKIVKFTSTKAWQLAPVDATWLDVSPKQGEAGEATLVIKLTETTTTEARSAEIKIISEEISKTIQVNQAIIELTNLELVTPPSSMTVGDKLKLEYTLTPENATIKNVTWTSSDDKVISVDQEGNIEALFAGTSEITLTVNDKTTTCQVEVIEQENVFTFRKLSNIENSGVTIEDGAYVVSSNFEIVEGTILRLFDNETVKLKDGIEIKISGTLDFTPKTKATITRYDEDNTSQPKSIYITGDNAGAEIKNVTFVDVPIRLYALQPVKIDSCEFKNVTSRRAAIDMGKSLDVKVTNCKFIENGYPAIAGASNSSTPLVFKNNYLYKNSASASNRPQINVTVGGIGIVEIIDNEVVGPAEITMNGGIAVSNLLGISGVNKVIIKGNKIKDCRYGITTNGVMDVDIIGNEILDNKYESNPMNGGSGISIYNTNGGQKVKISENIIKRNLWGITIIGSSTTTKGPIVNIGNLTEGADYNVGKNILAENGHDGVLYELYNNSPLDLSAVNNNWGSFEQSETEIEKVITHKNDNELLGKVTFMPPYKP
ncbi:MAG: Ig-like domain-containing protein [Bacteroidaceae bacterium]|nr:Ig-like domain-containing protein [Dysgonamonadaceae bacterium]MDD3310098.1 Ig-like domain-containing protein [Dysgonamonadaceae bacterium]MDD3901426.1 Ig-like domain-containing protein [Dysgonamonadaceae bacterium]MDD4399825.1 Ig-like domain-containing protein [Dysgonamonadaceae bacterium]